MKSEFPLIKLITPVSLVGFRDEASKKDYIEKVFADAYKSPLSLLILGTSPPLPFPNTQPNQLRF